MSIILSLVLGLLSGGCSEENDPQPEVSLPSAVSTEGDDNVPKPQGGGG
ncbi:MAG: hypothetical protein ABJF04_01675 [Reichenbachiella sp.]